MGGRRGQHYDLHKLWHALARTEGAGKHLQREQYQHREHSELWHRAGHGGHEDAQRSRGEEMQRSAGQKQRNRTRNRHAQRPLYDGQQSERGRQQHHQSHGPDFAEHDLGRRDRHYQQMLNGAMLAFANEGGAGQDYGEHRHIVNNL